jgi:ribosomal protein S18 acetylase RimI-like enzyme
VNQGEPAAVHRRALDLVDDEAAVPDAGEHGANPIGPLRMVRPGVVLQGRGVAGDYDVHTLTLAQVVSTIRVDGTWPGQLSLSSGWFRARARPWNDTVTDPMIRLERGGVEFLTMVTNRLGDMGGGGAYSPALYPGSTRVWKRAGYHEVAALAIMERGLGGTVPEPSLPITTAEVPDWEAVMAIDRAAFEGFWGMSALGLAEAHGTSRATTLLTASIDEGPAGYALVGCQWGVAYLHRIAVHPEAAGRGLGTSLLSASFVWALGAGGRSMVLNVRPGNHRARRVYERAGFTATGTDLLILRHEPR